MENTTNVNNTYVMDEKIERKLVAFVRSLKDKVTKIKCRYEFLPEEVCIKSLDFEDNEGNGGCITYTYYGNVLENHHEYFLSIETAGLNVKVTTRTAPKLWDVLFKYFKKNWNIESAIRCEGEPIETREADTETPAE